MKSLGEVLRLSVQYLQDRNIANPRRNAECLLAGVLSCKRMDLYMRFDQPLIDSELEFLRSALKKLVAGEPIDYILGSVDFFGVTLQVDKRALIPRVETEFLVEKAALSAAQGAVVWDVCTGTGCIGIALKKKRPDLNVVLIDISSEALALASVNAVKNLVDVEIVQSDLFSNLKGRRCDFICSNPPYIAADEYEKLDDSVRLYEPKLALVGGQTGLEFYQKFSERIGEFLNPGGKAIFEIGFDQAEGVKKVFSTLNGVRFIVLPDLSGKDRFFFLEMQ